MSERIPYVEPVLERQEQLGEVVAGITPIISGDTDHQLPE